MKKIKHKNLRLCMTKKIMHFRRNRATVIIRVRLFVAKSFYINIGKKRKLCDACQPPSIGGPRSPLATTLTTKCRRYTSEWWKRVPNTGILAVAKRNLKKHLFLNIDDRYFTYYSKEVTLRYYLDNRYMNFYYTFTHVIVFR